MNRDILSQLGQMQEKMAKAQEDLESRVAEGTAGGGAVTHQDQRRNEGDRASHRA